jgi:hypothetical protein
LVTPTPSSDGDVVREEAASIAATQVLVYASVDVASALYALTRTYAGVSDLRTLKTSACARMSM